VTEKRNGEEPSPKKSPGAGDEKNSGNKETGEVCGNARSIKKGGAAVATLEKTVVEQENWNIVTQKGRPVYGHQQTNSGEKH